MHSPLNLQKGRALPTPRVWLHSADPGEGVSGRSEPSGLCCSNSLAGQPPRMGQETWSLGSELPWGRPPHSELPSSRAFLMDGSLELCHSGWHGRTDSGPGTPGRSPALCEP